VKNECSTARRALLVRTLFVPFVFEVVQEGADQGRVEVGQVELARGRGGPPLRRAQQQPEGVAVGSHGPGASLALTNEPFGEERFERGGERGHGS
jgi:hypothetical protein